MRVVLTWVVSIYPGRWNMRRRRIPAPSPVDARTYVLLLQWISQGVRSKVSKVSKVSKISRAACQVRPRDEPVGKQSAATKWERASLVRTILHHLPRRDTEGDGGIERRRGVVCTTKAPSRRSLDVHRVLNRRESQTGED